MTTAFRFSDQALTGNLDAIVREAHEANWKVKIKQALPEDNVVCTVDITLSIRRDRNSGTAFMDPYSGVNSGWYCGSQARVHVYGETVRAAISRLNEALEALTQLQAGG